MTREQPNSRQKISRKAFLHFSLSVIVLVGIGKSMNQNIKVLITNKVSISALEKTVKM